MYRISLICRYIPVRLPQPTIHPPPLYLRQVIQQRGSSTRTVLAAKSGSRGEDPGLVLPGLDRVGNQPAPYCRGRHRDHQPLGHGLRGQLHRTPPRQRHLPLGGWLAGHRLDLGHHLRCERPRPTGPLPIVKSGKAGLGEALTPETGRSHVHVQPLGDPGVRLTVCGKQHDLRPDHRGERRGVGAGAFLQYLPITRRHPDHIRRDQRLIAASLRPPESASRPQLSRSGVPARSADDH